MAMPPILLRMCAPRYWTAWATWISIWPQIKMEQFLRAWCVFYGHLLIEKAISKMDCYNSSYVNDLMAKQSKAFPYLYIQHFFTSVSISIALLNHYQTFKHFAKSWKNYILSCDFHFQLFTFFSLLLAIYFLFTGFPLSSFVYVEYFFLGGASLKLSSRVVWYCRLPQRWSQHRPKSDGLCHTGSIKACLRRWNRSEIAQSIYNRKKTMGNLTKNQGLFKSRFLVHQKRYRWLWYTKIILIHRAFIYPSSTKVT